MREPRTTNSTTRPSQRERFEGFHAAHAALRRFALEVWQAHYARLLMATVPELAGFFEVRRLRAA
jgi:hypothetical protein